MNYPNFWDFQYIVNNDSCPSGIGCLYYNINMVSHGYLHFAVMFVFMLIFVFGSINNNNETSNSLIAGFYIFTILAIISRLSGLIDNKLLITFIILTAGSIAFKVGKDE